MIQTIKTWEEADKVLSHLGEAENHITEVETQLNEAITKEKKAAAELIKDAKDNIKIMSKMLEKFVTKNRTEMDGKSHNLMFGKVGFRKSSSVSVPRDTENIIKNLQKYKMDNCIKVEHKIDKEALEKYSDEQIAAVGCERKVKDTFYYEVDKEKLDKKVK